MIRGLHSAFRQDIFYNMLLSATNYIEIACVWMDGTRSARCNQLSAGLSDNYYQRCSHTKIVIKYSYKARKIFRSEYIHLTQIIPMFNYRRQRWHGLTLP